MVHFNPPAPRGTGLLCFCSTVRPNGNFNPPAPRGTGHITVSEGLRYVKFQSTRPSRDGTPSLDTTEPQVLFQSTRPSRDGTLTPVPLCRQSHDFNPPAPRGTGLDQDLVKKSKFEFQSTRPSRDGTARRVPVRFACVISIHPPLAGRDSSPPNFSRYDFDFNPPAPRGTGRMAHGTCPHGTLYFNPPAPRGPGHSAGGGRVQVRDISIHPPLAGRDNITVSEGLRYVKFQSTRPSRDGTRFQTGGSRAGNISIHPPLAGRDGDGMSTPTQKQIISIHPPLAGRDKNQQARWDTCRLISIHPPLAGRDVFDNVGNMIM